MSGLSILAVDDEAPSLDELAYLLRSSALVGPLATAKSATDALIRLRDERFDLLLLDVRMPGLDGLELARVLSKFSEPPVVVFVTAHEEHALEAFDVGAAGYLLKPLDLERLERVLRRVVGDRRSTEEVRDVETLAVESGGRTVMLSREEINWVESAGDYVRLHVRDGSSYLLRIPISALEDEWTDRGFGRIHRSYLVSLRDIQELRTEASRTWVVVAGHELPVSRRHLRELRDRLVRNARPSAR